MSRNPYSFSVRSSLSTDLILSDSPERSNKKNKSSKQRSKSMWSAGKGDKGNPPNKSSTLSSGSHSSSSDASARLFTSPVQQSFMPREVFLIPLHRQEDNSHHYRNSSDLWEFELLSEEEVRFINHTYQLFIANDIVDIVTSIYERLATPPPPPYLLWSVFLI